MPEGKYELVLKSLNEDCPSGGPWTWVSVTKNENNASGTETCICCGKVYKSGEEMLVSATVYLARFCMNRPECRARVKADPEKAKAVQKKWWHYA